MECAPDLNIPDDPKEITSAIIEKTYEIATAFLKENVSYIWNKERNHLKHWTICTWSRQVSNGYIKSMELIRTKQIW